MSEADGELNKKVDDERRPAVHTITEQKQIEALVSPVRGLLLSTLCSSGPCSVGELAQLVGRKPRALYYHLDALVDCGLVHEVGSRPTRRRQETLYDAIADTVLVDEHGVRDSAWLDAHRRAIAASLRQAIRVHDAAIADPTTITGGDCPELRMQTMQAQLTEDGLKRVMDMLEEMLTVMREEREKRSGRFYSLTLSFAPVVDAVDKGDDE